MFHVEHEGVARRGQAVRGQGGWLSDRGKTPETGWRQTLEKTPQIGAKSPQTAPLRWGDSSHCGEPSRAGTGGGCRAGDEPRADRLGAEVHLDEGGEVGPEELDAILAAVDGRGGVGVGGRLAGVAEGMFHMEHC